MKPFNVIRTLVALCLLVCASAASAQWTGYPIVTVDTICSGRPYWSVHVIDTAAEDSFISSIKIDSELSSNIAFDPVDFKITPGQDTKADLNVVVQNPLKNAVAYLWVTNGAGNDTVCYMTYAPPALKFGAVTSDGVDANGDARLNFKDAQVGVDTCSQFVFKNVSVAGSLAIHLNNIRFQLGGQGFTATPVDLSGNVLNLPISMKPGDSVIIKVCFNTSQSGRTMMDTLFAETDCPAAIGFVQGSTTLPEILATDRDFGKVDVGIMVSHTIRVSNSGKAPFTLTKDWTIINYGAADFTFVDGAKLPVMLQPGTSIDLSVSFTPSNALTRDSSVIVWGTDMSQEIKTTKKNYSVLTGYGFQSASVRESAFISVSVSPNPVSEQLTVHLSRNTVNTNIELFDILGNHVSKQKGSGNESVIDIHSFAPGIYFLRVETAEGIVTKQFVKE